jgi:mRNA interferase HicA
MNMKRRDLMRLFEKNGWRLSREGSNHTIITDGLHNETIPRHNEINEILAKNLIKRWKLK